MSYKLKPDKMYLMPFNNFCEIPLPSMVKQVKGSNTQYGEVLNLSIQYETTCDAISAVIPEPFEPADDPLVTVFFQQCKSVSFMAGRSYNIVGVLVNSIFNGRKDHIESAYAVTVWENDFHPILLGREVLGIPKLFADIPDATLHPDGAWRFNCSNYGVTLLEAEITNTEIADGELLELVKKASRQSVMLGWKYIPTLNPGESDASYPTMTPECNRYPAIVDRSREDQAQ